MVTFNMSKETTYIISEQDYVRAMLGLAAIFGNALIKSGAIGALVGGGVVIIITGWSLCSQVGKNIEVAPK